MVSLREMEKFGLQWSNTNWRLIIWKLLCVHIIKTFIEIREMVSFLKGTYMISLLRRYTAKNAWICTVIYHNVVFNIIR